ncbi:MAG: NAD-dependent epimerase/dehydratase family protein [Myxococcales bacterium]|nr:NAD-dependent epimerase/dehydratase family protein [Myxococcota bacterium]MDW8283813.1 NAD-dependent epimerase/dehydratase family protein [Myxococcales bacterium]
MRVFVTGCAGFIGSHLCERLLARGEEVVGLDCFDETLYPAALHRDNLVPLLAHRRFRFSEGDVCDGSLLPRVLSGCDAVVHLAALAGVRPSLSQAARYMRVNVEGTATLLAACRAAGVRRFVFASSSSVYGAHSPVPFREDDPAVRPASPYAASKRAAELLCVTETELYGTATTALRFFTVYGPRQRPEMAIHKFARLILAGAPVPLYGDGTTARDYTYIDDIIDGVLAALERTVDPVHRVYNLGGSQPTSLLTLVRLLEEELGRPARLEQHPEQRGDVPRTWADLSLAARDLGYAPRTPLPEGLHRFCTWLKSRPS